MTNVNSTTNLGDGELLAGRDKYESPQKMKHLTGTLAPGAGGPLRSPPPHGVLAVNTHTGEDHHGVGESHGFSFQFDHTWTRPCRLPV